MYLFKRNGYYQLAYFNEAENRFKRISTNTKLRYEALSFLSDFKRKLKEKPKVEFIILSHFRDEYILHLSKTHSKKYLISVKLSFKMLIEFLGDIPLASLDNRILDKFVTITFGRTKAGAGLYYRTLKASFSKAIDWKYLNENPLKQVKMPKIPKSIPQFISSSELEQILSKTEIEDLKDLCFFAFQTGMRLGEILNLRWNSVDFIEKLITVANTESFTTKNKKERIIPMNNGLIDMLNRRKPKIISFTNSDFVFQETFGNKYDEGYVSKKFKEAVRSAKLNDKIHFHTLRHSFASNLVQRGVSLYVVKELLGHESIQTTQIYSHLQKENLSEAIALMNAAN